MDNQLTGENRILWSRVIGAALVAALIVTAIWFVFLRSDKKENPTSITKTSSGGSEQRSPAPASGPNSGAAPAPQPTNPATPSANTPGPASTAPAPTPSRPQSSAGSAPQLSNTGPGDVVKVFAISSAAAGAGHYLFMRRWTRTRSKV